MFCLAFYILPMNIEKVTKLKPIEIGYILDPARPVIPLAMEVSRAGCAAPHAHPRGQLVYAGRGVMRVYCSEGAWVVPSSQAVWLPSQAEHEVYFPGEVSLRNLFIDPSAIMAMPEKCCVLEVGPLLRELILRAVEIGDEYHRGTPEWRLMQVLLDELRRAQPAALYLPTARSPVLRRLMDALQAAPADNRTLDEWATVLRMGSRTLARQFIRETGMTFGAWRQQLRLLEAVTRLGQGKSVTEVSWELGYQSQSAFTAMFRRALGVPPVKYMYRSAD